MARTVRKVKSGEEGFVPSQDTFTVEETRPTPIARKSIMSVATVDTKIGLLIKRKQQLTDMLDIKINELEALKAELLAL